MTVWVYINTAKEAGDVVAPLSFDRIYGIWWGRNIAASAKAPSMHRCGAILRRSSRRRP